MISKATCWIIGQPPDGVKAYSRAFWPDGPTEIDQGGAGEIWRACKTPPRGIDKNLVIP